MVLDKLPADEPRYLVMDWDVENDDGCQMSKIFFVSWVPDTCKAKTKMLYASSKQALRNALEGVHLVQGLSGNVIGVAAGRAHALAVTADGQVWAWGSNEAGQLGVAPRADAEGTPVLVVGEGASGIAAGGDVSACCLANGTLLVWGLDSHPRAVAAAAREEMQDDGSPSALGWEPQTVGRLGTARIVSVAVGGDGRVLARDEAGAVFAWGANDRGQCGFKGKRLRPSQKARASSAATRARPQP